MRKNDILCETESKQITKNSDKPFVSYTNVFVKMFFLIDFRCKSFNDGNTEIPADKCADGQTLWFLRTAAKFKNSFKISQTKSLEEYCPLDHDPPCVYKEVDIITEKTLFVIDYVSNVYQSYNSAKNEMNPD